jgi:hypothetical protein
VKVENPQAGLRILPTKWRLDGPFPFSRVVSGGVEAWDAPKERRRLIGVVIVSKATNA